MLINKQSTSHPMVAGQPGQSFWLDSVVDVASDGAGVAHDEYTTEVWASGSSLFHPRLSLALNRASRRMRLSQSHSLESQRLCWHSFLSWSPTLRPKDAPLAAAAPRGSSGAISPKSRNGVSTL